MVSHASQSSVSFKILFIGVYLYCIFYCVSVNLSFYCQFLLIFIPVCFCVFYVSCFVCCHLAYVIKGDDSGLCVCVKQGLKCVFGECKACCRRSVYKQSISCPGTVLQQCSLYTATLKNGSYLFPFHFGAGQPLLPRRLRPQSGPSAIP